MSRLTIDRESLAHLARRFGAQAALVGGQLQVTIGSVAVALDRCDLGGSVHAGPVAMVLTGTRLADDGIEVDFSVDPGAPATGR